MAHVVPARDDSCYASDDETVDCSAAHPNTSLLIALAKAQQEFQETYRDVAMMRVDVRLLSDAMAGKLPAVPWMRARLIALLSQQ